MLHTWKPCKHCYFMCTFIFSGKRLRILYQITVFLHRAWYIGLCCPCRYPAIILADLKGHWYFASYSHQIRDIVDHCWNIENIHSGYTKAKKSAKIFVAIFDQLYFLNKLAHHTYYNSVVCHFWDFLAICLIIVTLPRTPTCCFRFCLFWELVQQMIRKLCVFMLRNPDLKTIYKIKQCLTFLNQIWISSIFNNCRIWRGGGQIKDMDKRRYIFPTWSNQVSLEQ